ncbi:hypothetical protein PVAP13_5NG579850 [Panicum virgatum]|uniref:Uncharacterized protein n=1 Tax=Panicum virgatum TaxID=38727 RepID=A0A8T0S7P8_PANVG|nr:hypothetical protein PVAP13_5NG579850 [Panicum virgatum]
MALAFLLRFVRGTACRSPARAPGFQTAPSTSARCIAPCRSRIALAKVPGRLVSGRRSVHPSVPTRARSTYASRPHVPCVIGIGGCRCGIGIGSSKYLNTFVSRGRMIALHARRPMQLRRERGRPAGAGSLVPLGFSGGAAAAAAPRQGCERNPAGRDALFGSTVRVHCARRGRARHQLFVRAQFGRPTGARRVAGDLGRKQRDPARPRRALPYSGSGQSCRSRSTRVAGAPRRYVTNSSEHCCSGGVCCN